MTVSVHNPDQYMASLRQIIAQPFSGDGIRDGIGTIVNKRKGRYRRYEFHDLTVSGEAYRYCSS